ncbi:MULTISPECIES: YggS family pyridoxal phosphate-dependent enzyme [Frigoribacterium]|uniref:YggS family pyridoxal phosphate-dependent enzyme n=1 Tax=Frigoribacterium TaxID=96492 RepID=UPI0006F2219B|nr:MULTISPECIES: YggS family pyridoxal phosphate-dependent enzyme [Frigoribacterium]KQM25038.1 alanine racemase [Frigoribacterium sp. Leaf8]WAC53290.1 YggS family pyridoxal phosphate-dependent enzyme [Frigoribacterium sp. SL97]
MTDPTDVDGDLGERLARVAAAVDDACTAVGRSPGELTTIVVTKFHPPGLIRALYALGVRDVGENRHQEAQTKAVELDDLDGLRWHFVGQLQSKKARQARRYANAVHSLDRDSVVGALSDDSGSLVDGFVQVNLTDDPGRGGVAEHEVERLAERVLSTPGLRLRGVMAVAPLGEEARPAFARLRAVSERVRSLEASADAISAGMSPDFAEAVAEGATHLRIGTAITGSRPDAR